MRISDWSSDVCSSDLPHRIDEQARKEKRRPLGMLIGNLADAVRQGLERGGAQKRIVFPELIFHRLRDDRNQRFPGVQSGFPGLFAEIPQPLVAVEIGIASCRERVWTNV